jgi:hypothetical protein|tara:strand:+ start:3919 stop:4512 length:594 start_codon:yes stop_codon:yes gene_type:complete
VADFDISNTLVSDTFGRLLQIATDNVVYDATGSFLDEFKISGSFTTSEYVEITNGDNQTGNKLHSRNGTLYWGGTNLESGGGGISNMLEDQTPQLGGPLDVNSKNVSGSGNFLINGSGSFVQFNIGDTSNDFNAIFNLAPSTIDQDIMLVKSSSIDSFKVNKSGVVSFGSFSSAPTAVTGGVYYNNTTEEFFIGVGE